MASKRMTASRSASGLVRTPSTEHMMTTRLQWRTLLSLALLMLTLISGGVRAVEIPVVTGQQWTTSSEEAKKAYLVGIANLIAIENAFNGQSSPLVTESLAGRIAKGLEGQTLDSVRQGLDQWYAANPDKLQRPVIETIWFEMVEPGLQKSR